LAGGPAGAFSGRYDVPDRAVVIVPTYNERENILKLIDAVLAQSPILEILVVDDGSPDGTGALVDERAAVDSRVHIIHREKKLGLGTAYLAGFKWALSRPYEFIFEMDADFSHDPQHLPQFLSSIENADLVIGSRYRDRRVTVVNWPIERLLLSYFANVYARFVTRLPIFDTTAGYKCFRRKVLESVDLNDVRSNGYAFQIEMHFRVWRQNFRIVEIPIVFVDRTEGTSKMSKKIVREAVWMVWRLRWWALTGRV
jgi:dolichol-phosphate mannosyltransferase